MERDIYKLFTVNHGIRMAPATLKYISTHVTSNNELKDLLRSFKAIFNTSEITEEQARKILTEKQEAEELLYLVHSTKYQAKHLSSKYDRFKARIPANITSISLLEDGVEASIFGIFYKDGTGMPILEDDYGFITLSLEACESNLFLHENMFLAFTGKKENAIFVVKTAILPMVSSTGAKYSYDMENHSNVCAAPSNYTGVGGSGDAMTVSSGKNDFLRSGNVKICVFGCYTNEKDCIDRILVREQPDIIIISLCVSNKVPYESTRTKVVLCPCRCSNRLLPDRVDARCSGNYATNPFLLELHNKKLAVIDHNLFTYKRFGLFYNKQPLRAFLDGIYSQQSFNPFAPNDLSFPVVPDIFIIIQDFYPFVMDIESTRMVSLLPVKAGSYAVIETGNDLIEIKQTSEG